jgi:hypothetical protein
MMLSIMGVGWTPRMLKEPPMLADDATEGDKVRSKIDIVIFGLTVPKETEGVIERKFVTMDSGCLVRFPDSNEPVFVPFKYLDQLTSH